MDHEERGGSRVLVVDDDVDLQHLVARLLEREGLVVQRVGSAAAARRQLAEQGPAAIVLDLGLPDESGQDLLTSIRDQHPDLPVVILTSETDVEQIVACMRLGATDYVTKPFRHERLRRAVLGALRQRVPAGASTYVESVPREAGFRRILGRSTGLEQAMRLLTRAAQSTVTVLLEGESGTGKEIAARAIHAEGPRRSQPFVAINCGAIPETLIENELFGHERGSFTGASGAQLGRFEQAHGGTLFLDEIGELPVELQVRLLRVLEERLVWRIGAESGRPIDVRVIAASNRDLREDGERGRFRRDLYYRLAVFPVRLPPLRERRGDISLLAREFVRRFAREYRRDLHTIAPAALALLERHPWPGNVRELLNVIERAVILEDGATIQAHSLPEEFHALAGFAARAEPAGDDTTILPFAEHERRIIQRALELTGGNVHRAARQLGLGRATIYRKIERYGLRRPDGATEEVSG